MGTQVIEILDIFSIRGREHPLVAFKFCNEGEFRPLLKGIFADAETQTVWRVSELAHIDPPTPGRDAGEFIRVSGNGELRAGMKLIEADALPTRRTIGAA